MEIKKKHGVRNIRDMTGNCWLCQVLHCVSEKRK